MARAYTHIGLLYGLYRLACARGKIYPFVKRICLRLLYCVLKVLSPGVSFLVWLSEYCRRGCPADCVSGGPPTKYGYFRWNEKDFVRHQDDSISRVKLTGGSTTIDACGAEVTAYNWDILEPARPIDLSPGESALTGLRSNARPSSLEKGQVLVHDSLLNMFSAGVVFNNILVMCRHKTAGMTHIIVRGTNTTSVAGRQAGVRISLDRARYLDSFGAPQWNEGRHTCTFLDFMAIPLEKDEISMIGVKTLKDKDITRNYELQRGTITYATDDFGSIVKEEGSIPEADLRTHNLGLALAHIVSQPGASSSGVGVVQGGYKLAGLWLGQPSHSLSKHRGRANLFMHTDAMVANLEKVGLYKHPLLERLQQWGDSLQSGAVSTEGQGESRESKKERAARQWFEYYQELENEDDDFKKFSDVAWERFEEEVIDYNAYGHARTQPAIVLPLKSAGPGPALSPPSGIHPGESAAEEALAVVRANILLDVDRNVRSWKHGILRGEAPRVLREIAYYREEATADVRERLRTVLATPSNSLLRDYMQKVSPLWSPGQDGEAIFDIDGNPYFRRVGSYESSKPPKPKKYREEESDLQRRLRALATRYYDERRHGCKKGEYRIPTSSKKNVDRSLRAQAALATASPPRLTSEQREDFDAAVKLVREKYSEGVGSEPIKTYLEEGEYGILKTFIGFEDKSSGVSTRFRNMKKAAWVKEHPEEVVDLALSRLILIALAGDQLEELDAIELVRLGCADVKDIFMKPEEHSPQKMAEGRFRLIWISSLVDLAVQALLHKADNAAHVDSYQAGHLTCAAIGMGHSPEGLRQLVKAFQKEGVAERNVSSDASAFDLSVDGSFIHADGERRASNCADADVARLVKRYAHVLCSHVLNNNGDVWLCVKYGVTSSGQLSTTAQNTFARSVMAAYGGCKGWTCAGDDLVGDEDFDERRLLDFGIRSRDVEHHIGEADFTSHLINTESATAVFGNVEKMLWHLYDTCTDVPTNRERFGSCLYILRDTPGVLEDVTAITKDFGIDTDGYVAESSLIRDLA